MKTDEYVRAIEKLSEEYIQIYNNPLLQKARFRKGIKNNLSSCKFKPVLKSIKIRIKEKIKPWKKIIDLSSQKVCDRYGKKVVYTCIIGSYDKLWDIKIPTKNVDYIVFTDQAEITKESNYWKRSFIPKYIMQKCDYNPILINRYIKMHPQELFPNYDYSLYVDGSIEIISEVDECFSYINDQSGLALHTHRRRNDVYEEAKCCLALKRGNSQAIKKQIKKYKAEKLPKLSGLFEAGVIACDLKNSTAKIILDKWYQEFKKSNINRDQLILPYILWKNNISIVDIGTYETNIFDNPKFRVHSHWRPKREPNHIYLKLRQFVKKTGLHRRIYNFGLRYKCNICKSHLKEFHYHKCPVCTTSLPERMLYFYLKKKTNIFQKSYNILNLIDYRVTSYKLSKKSHLYNLENLKDVKFDYVLTTQDMLALIIDKYLTKLENCKCICLTNDNIEKDLNGLLYKKYTIPLNKKYEFNAKFYVYEITLSSSFQSIQDI